MKGKGIEVKGKIRFPKNKRGASLLLAVMLILVMGIVLGGLATLGRLDIFAGQTIALTDDVFYLAESGVEVGINWLRNVDEGGTSKNWWNNARADGTLEPDLSFTMGSGTVDLSVRYPAARLKADTADPSVTSVTYLEVYSVEPFAVEGQINHPAEVFYVSIDNDLIRISNYNSTLEQLLIDSGTPGEGVDVQHFLPDKVYPVAILNADIGLTDEVVPVSNTRGFLEAGTVQLYHPNSGTKEYIRYTGKTGTSFLNGKRGSNASTALDPTLTEVNNDEWWVLPVDYEAFLVSTGTANGVSKTLEVTVQYKDF